jgi:hypothetical protein
MTLNPAWFNALVDDTGTGTTGTVWNKATIKGLTDNIDAELTRLNYYHTTWTPDLRVTPAGGVPAYSARTALYALVAQHLCWIGFYLAFTKGSLGAGSLALSLPFPSLNVGQFGGMTIPYFSGLGTPVASLGSYSIANTDAMNLVYVPAGGGTASAFLQTSHLGAGTVELMGTAVYII